MIRFVTKWQYHLKNIKTLITTPPPPTFVSSPKKHIHPDMV